MSVSDTTHMEELDIGEHLKNYGFAKTMESPVSYIANSSSFKRECHVNLSCVFCYRCNNGRNGTTMNSIHRK